MKKYLLLCLSILTVAGVGVVLSSCESDDPPPNPKVNFARATRTIAENAGSLEVEVTLDRALDKAVVISYDIDGTAQQGVDYTIPIDIGEVEIPAGSTSGVIEIVITNDNVYEGNETIELRIFDTTNGVEIGEQDEIIITITEDDAAPVVSFTETTFTVNEDDGGYDLEVSLSAPSGQDVIVNYEIDGSAIDSLWGWENEFPDFYYDYFIDGESGTVTIPAGETTRVIKIRIYTDFFFEGSESMVFTLTGATGATLTTVTANRKATGTLTQQDGRGVELYWNNKNANLNLFVWFGTSVENLATINENTLIWGFSTWAQTPNDDEDPFEGVFVPTILKNFSSVASLDAFAVSVLYKTGSVEPLDFELFHFDFVAPNTFEEVSSHIGTYTLENLNNFPQSSGPLVFPKTVQTFERIGGAYTVPTDITEPASGSRASSGSTSKFPTIVKTKQLRPVSASELRKLQMRGKRGDLNIRSVKR